ncbi:MAG: preprotein translocase subunit YajC [Planctomycetota bacterium]|jgi:preprotein translocase subunit YajC
MNIFFAAGGFDPMPIILIMGVFLFVVILPARKEKKKKAALMENLTKGDRLLFTSGLIGKLVENKNESLIVDSHGSRFEILTSTVVKIIDLKKDD